MAGVLEREEEEGTYTLLWWVAWMGGWKVGGWFRFAEDGLLDANRHGAVSFQRSTLGGVQHREHKGSRELSWLGSFQLFFHPLTIRR